MGGILGGEGETEFDQRDRLEIFCALLSSCFSKQAEMAREGDLFYSSWFGGVGWSWEFGVWEVSQRSSWSGDVLHKASLLSWQLYEFLMEMSLI